MLVSLYSLCLKLLMRHVAQCPRCGCRRVAVEIVRSPRVVVDGMTVAKCRCRSCQFSWSLPMRRGI
jgi:hypothetical protein